MSRIISSSSGDRLNWSQVYFGVALTTLATLVLELSLTRIFSVVFLYHFAFLAISIALFGLGAGGVLSYLINLKGKPLYRRLGFLASGVSVATVGALIVALTRRDLELPTLTIVYFTSAVPFLFAGMIVSLAISETIERIDRVYFFDLMGAAAGCLVLVPFLNLFGGPNTVIAAGVLYAVSASIWFNLGGSSRGRAGGVAVALVLTALIVVNMTRKPLIDVTFAKGMSLANDVFVKWNSFSRIAVAREPQSGQMQIVIDADASTGIATFDFNNLSENERKDLAYQGPGFPYQVRPGGKTLIIGPGGGWDVARAIASGSKDITGVEINPIIANTVMRDKFAKLSRDLYFRDGVRIFVEDGRSFVRRSAEKYQIIQATLVDTWASTAAGAFALSENNLYTTEAFEDYLKHLTDDGILVFTRWGFDPPRESLRLLSLARVALGRLGEHDYRNHVMVVREGGASELAGWGARDTVLISRKPLQAADLERARTAIKLSNMQAVYMPGDAVTNPFGEILTTSDPKSFYENYQYKVSPVDDNQPFFFYTVQARDVLGFFQMQSSKSADFKVNRAVPLLFALVAISIVATGIVLILPPAVLGTRLPRERGVLTFLMYFGCIGIGYILIQVALIQKFVLLLGHPTYALTVIIFSMLVASGLGSYFSRRLLGKSDPRLMQALLAVAALVTLLAFLAPVVSNGAIAWPLPVKMLITSALIVCPAFAMGMPFPTGLSRLEERHPASVRWAWALNAASSVLGSATAIFLAIYLGLQNTMLVGALLYVGAALIVLATRRDGVAAQQANTTY